MTTTAPPRQAAASHALDGYLRMLAGLAPGARLLEIRFALRHREMGRVFIAAHSAAGASRFILRLAVRTDVYVSACAAAAVAGATRSTNHNSRSSRSTHPTPSTGSPGSPTRRR